MKRFLLVSSLCLVVMAAVADNYIRKVAVFDFHHPTSLTPAIDFGLESVYDISRTTFTDRDVALKVERMPLSLTPVLNQNIKPGWCGLQFPSYAVMTITVGDAYELDYVDMVSLGFYDGTGGITLYKSTPYGTYKHGRWSCIDANEQHVSGVKKIQFIVNNKSDAVLSGVKVYYLSPQDALKYTSVSPAIDEETDPFTGYTINFPTAVTVKSGVLFEVKDANEQTVAILTPAVNGKKVTLTPDAPITKAGAYTLAVPAEAFTTEEGEYNQAFTLSFTVKDYADSFAYETISLPVGRVKELTNPIELTFPSPIGTINAEGLKFTNADETVTKDVVFSVSETDDTKLLLTLDETVTDLETLTLTVPENTIQAADGFHYNPAFTLTYTIMGYDVPSDELVAKAEALLQLTGPGYPRTGSDARQALSDVVNGENKSRQEYEQAVSDFISTDDVVFPAYGKYYTFAKKQSHDAANQLFLGYEDDFYATTEADAEHFLFVDNEGVRTIQMTDGTLKAVTVTKTVADDPNDAFGLLTIDIEGYEDDVDGIGYQVTLTNSRDPKNESTFDPISGTETDELPELTITVAQAQAITYHEDFPISVLVGDEEIEGAVRNVTTEGNKLIVSFALPTLPNAVTYTVDVPEGAITFHSIDHEAVVPAMSAEYKLSSEFGFGNFMSLYSLFSMYDSGKTYTSDVMNEIAVMSNQTELCLNPHYNKVSLVNENGVTLYTGTLEKVTDSPYNDLGWSVLKFSFNTEFNETNLPDGQYWFVIEKGVFGDSNFGQYVSDPASIAKRDCYIIGQTYHTYTVDNHPTGVTTVKAAAAAGAVYDLTGRRVKQVTKPGLYIQDGKKMLFTK